jgi:hypothetical protein
LAGVPNQSQMLVSSVISAKQLSSSLSWAARPVPVLLAQFPRTTH